MLPLILLGVFATAVCGLNISSLVNYERLSRNQRVRIVGGRLGTIEQFPYQVSILHVRSHICGGSIYKPDIVITAAHCLADIRIRQLAVVAGTTDWGYGGVESAVKSFAQHPRYASSTLDYDIAILKLKNKLSYGRTIQPIALPFYRQEFAEGSVGVVSGWGALGEHEDEPDELQYTTLKVISLSDCYKSYANIHKVTRNMMCAWIQDGGYGTCQGDSGSALVIGNVMAGIVSWGLGCARPNVPEVYTKVSILRRWIDFQIEATN